ncbi:MAG: hypothetical protein F4Y26_12210 [Gammaproteobacteria bacterium]|nr:hypothetical protein [Gammaproteobacteria bacterium]
MRPRSWAALPSLAQIRSVEIEPVTPGAPGTKSTYRAGQTFALRFGFDEILPDISQAGITANVEVGDGTKSTAVCAADGSFLLCPYTVVTTDEDKDGVSVENPPINDPRRVLPSLNPAGLPDGWDSPCSAATICSPLSVFHQRMAMASSAVCANAGCDAAANKGSTYAKARSGG